MKHLIIALSILGFSSLFISCNKEEPLPPSADFTTSLSNFTAYAGEPFVLYLKNCSGDFLTLFKGDTPGSTYGNDSLVAQGLTIDTSLDSILVTYDAAGTYTLTLLAASYGNWSKDQVVKTKSVTINVIDRRAGLRKITIDKVDGVFSQSGTEIYFYATKVDNLTAKKPIFFTTSLSAKVYINDVEQISGVSVVDFSPLNPGDNEGRPVIYKVVAPNGESREYTVKYILRDPLTGKQLLSLTSSTLGKTFYPDENAKSIEIIYPTGTDLTKLKVMAKVSLGAIATIGTKQIQDKEQTVDIAANNKIVVKAEDLSTQDYAIVKTEVEKITAFRFIKAGTLDLNPPPQGTIDFPNRKITVNVLQGTDKTRLVAEFTGLSVYTLKAGDTVITSGITEYDYSGDVTLDLYKDGRKLDSYLVKVNTVSK
ncbi:MAG: hypothetical protein ACPLXM_12110 [Bacteroidales bacterium]